MKPSILLSFFIASTLLFCGMARAQPAGVETFGEYEVHYSIFNTSFLTPEVAKRNDIVRSKRKGMVTISVIKKPMADATTESQLNSPIGVSANVTGNVYDLIHRTPLTFKKVREQTAIYYLATFDIENRIDVYFTFNVQPDPNKDPLTIELKKRLYWDQ